MRLRDRFQTAKIIAHTECTTELERVLRQEGIESTVVRGSYPRGSERWSPSSRCLWNHRNAWLEIEVDGRPTLIVEADFVPVTGFGLLTAPLDIERVPGSFAYLYACGPQLWDLDGGLRGHAGSTVSYCISAALASTLIAFADTEFAQIDPTAYLAWDSKLGFWLNARGVQTNLPYRNYGEHGGEPNFEHRRAGLRATHRADVLAGPLAFLPAYARGSRTRYFGIRARARVWGVMRLLTGRYLARHDLRRSREKARLLRVAVGRHFLHQPPSWLRKARA